MLRWICVGAWLTVSLPADGAGRVALLIDGKLEAPAEHGITKLRESLAAKGFTVDSRVDGRAAGADFAIIAGVALNGLAPRVLSIQNVALPKSAEALVVRRTSLEGKPALVLCGSDARGLMYAALDVAGDVSDHGVPWQNVRDTSESPYLAERGISIYTMQRAWFESRLYDEKHWRRYFDLLAASRINAFTVIFGYENGGFMAPLYPYFFHVGEYPGVRMVGLTAEQQQHNTTAFRTMIRIAHERGISVIVGVWDHIYRGGVQGGGIAGASDLVGKDVSGLVTGITSENLGSYTKAALRRFLEVFPEVDGLEFRMHNESGLKNDEMAGFWHEVFGILANAKPGMLVTLRAKELPDAIIQDALDRGLNARIETKYWMEQMGMPFHPTHINRQDQRGRRHGYADLLQYPQRYRVHWRLWSGGTARLLLWADPVYVRRFAESARLYGGNSFDVNEMLATKMLGEPHEKPPAPILAERDRYYEFEFERYWHFFQVWGRVSYNPAVGAEVWEREFVRRFGAAGLPLMQGLHAASNVLPRIVAASYRYQLFPTTRGWAEMMRQEDLPKFADLEGSDIEQFMSPREAAKNLIAGTAGSKRTPEETSRWFDGIAETITRHTRAAESAGASGKEARSTLTDLRILGALARFHAARLRAAVQYNVYRESGSLAAFDAAIAGERLAIASWEEIVKAASDVYAPDLAFGVHRVGFSRHWKEELGKLNAGLATLQSEREKARGSRTAPLIRASVAAPPKLRLDPVGKARPGKDLRVTVRAERPAEVKTVRLRYRHLTQVEDYLAVEMKPAGGGIFAASIPGAFIVPKWDVMYFVEVTGANGGGRNYPDLDVETPYVIVPVER